MILILDYTLFPVQNIVEIIKAPAAVCLLSHLESIFETIQVLQVHIHGLFYILAYVKTKPKLEL